MKIEKKKVTTEDLKGEIEGFPVEVVQAMCDEQVAQGNPFNPAVFAKNNGAGRTQGGFDWDGLDGDEDLFRLWDVIIPLHRFELLSVVFKIRGHSENMDSWS